ncbi:MAG: hypothetical protein H6742_02595 [Alphaproteobacteria bacterium]|nr:hypothetical protein [Alphaproteobacteria bacterium]
MSFWLGGTPGGTGELSWTTPTIGIAVAVAVGLLAWALAAWSGRGGRRPLLRVGELVLWAVALAVLVAAVAGPVWIEERGRVEPGKLVVLVDGSASMGVVEGARPRGDEVAPLLERIVDADTDVYTFDEDLHAGPPTGWQGRGTDLGVALDLVSDRYLGQDLRGVVVITDGLDRGGLRDELAAAVAAGESLDGRLPPLGGPLTVYQIGSADELFDIAVEDVVSGGFAFLRTDFTLTARLRGPPGRTLPVTLSREGQGVDSAEVTLDEEGRAEVAFEVRPPRVGRFAYEVSVPVEPGDAVPGNNSFPVVVRVVRDRTRVLQVSGSPAYDTKFLRLFLKEDPSVDLVSFFILRTREDMGAGWQSEELSLIAFPYERLFREDIGSFDLVIFQNFDYKPYFDWSANELLANIGQYVEDGGAFVMTGGDRSFDLGAYQGTPVGDVLPVRLGVTGPQSAAEPFAPVLTDAGRVHPITRIGATPEATEAAWQALPEMDGANVVVGLAPDSAALLSHPTLTGRDGAAMPVLAVREVGEGRTMALMVDSSWRWSFSEAAQGRGNQAYLRFWKNALRWLMADPEDQRVVVSPARENVLLGDELRIVAKVRDAGYLPTEGAAVEGRIVAPSGEETPLSLTTDASGEAAVLFAPTEQGAHRVYVRSPGIPGTAETVFAATSRDPELVEIVPDGAFLAALVAAAGPDAALRAPGAGGGPVVDADAGREVMDRRETRLAGAPLVALLFGLCAGGAWILRRRNGAR